MAHTGGFVEFLFFGGGGVSGSGSWGMLPGILGLTRGFNALVPGFCCVQTLMLKMILAYFR